MRFDLDHLPTDPALLHPLVRDMATVVAQHEAQIERLQLIIKQLQRSQFGRRSEQLNDDQLALGLEEADTDQADTFARTPILHDDVSPDDPSPRRKALPEHLIRIEHLLNIEWALLIIAQVWSGLR